VSQKKARGYFAKSVIAGGLALSAQANANDVNTQIAVYTQSVAAALYVVETHKKDKEVEEE